METKDKEERSFIDKVIIKWYEDPEVLKMVKKRLVWPSVERKTKLDFLICSGEKFPVYKIH